eukprot:6469888-Amphidinium_carterae.1
MLRLCNAKLADIVFGAACVWEVRNSIILTGTQLTCACARHGETSICLVSTCSPSQICHRRRSHQQEDVHEETLRHVSNLQVTYAMPSHTHQMLHDFVEDCTD